MQTPADSYNMVWAYVLAVLAVPLLGGLAAAIGAIAWARIRRSGGKLRGTPLAIGAIVIGGLMVVSSLFLMMAAYRASMQRATASGRAEANGDGATAETSVPVAAAAAAHSWSWWQALRGMGLLGLLVVAIGVCVLLSVVVGAVFDKLLWMPAAGGVFALLVGLLGTVIGMATAFSKVASLGGAVNPGDLAEGISMALVNTFMGLGVLVIGILATAGLGVFHGYRRESVAARQSLNCA